MIVIFPCVIWGQSKKSRYAFKLVMDYWCALWFWPIEKANLLPRYWFR
jgi:hypothetical protein